MPDPVHTVLGVYKGVSIVAKAGAFLERLARQNTERFIAARDEMHREWSAETAVRLAEHVKESRERFLQLGGTLEEHERLINGLLEQQELQVLAALYADAAYREAIEERRRMLSFAAASLVDADMSFQEKAGVERVLRSLDPTDVLELHKLSRTVGKHRRLSAARGETYPSTSALTHALLSASPSDDALSAERCVREAVVTPDGGLAGGGTPAHEVAHVTDRGALVLRVLEKYIAERHDAFVGCGREEVAGSRSEVEARKVLAGVPGFVAAIHAAIQAGRQSERYLRARFDQAAPTLARNLSGAGDLVDPEPRAASRLHLPAIPPAAASSIPSPSSGHELTIRSEDLPGYGRPAVNVFIEGPFDVLRWLADDLDARWS